jgi:hypothetical protein
LIKVVDSSGLELVCLKSFIKVGLQFH